LEFSWSIKILLIFICFFLSAFFSGSEVALFSFDKKKVRDLKKKYPIAGSYVQSLLENPKRLLVIILLGNTIVNVAASILSVELALEISKKIGISEEIALVVQISILTILLLFLGEAAPKLWANKYPVQFARVVAMPLYWLGIIFYPVAKILTESLRFLSSKMKFDRSKTALRTGEISELANIGIEKGTIEVEEHELIHSIVSFKSVTAREIMTPRVDMVAISVDANFDELVNLINDSSYSRIPLYKDSLDQIIGIVYAKDLIPYLFNSELRKTVSIKNLSHEPLFVPQTKSISTLLNEFQEKKTHLGIVVDEYGGTAGLISLEDILEEIVGEIRDEYDNEVSKIEKIDNNKYIILGKVAINQLNELLDYNFSSENDDYETVGGFIFSQTGTIPEQGFHFIHNNFKFTVKEVVNKRINKVLVEII
jgi:gliding motility-associated protein GldE